MQNGNGNGNHMEPPYYSGFRVKASNKKVTTTTSLRVHTCRNLSRTQFFLHRRPRTFRDTAIIPINQCIFPVSMSFHLLFHLTCHFDDISKPYITARDPSKLWLTQRVRDSTTKVVLFPIFSLLWVQFSGVRA